MTLCASSHRPSAPRFGTDCRYAYHLLACQLPSKIPTTAPIRDLRVSLTDRCNFRCFYCLPHGEPPIAPKEQMLSYEEIEYVCDIFVELGIEKIRLTGGEPMMRRTSRRSSVSSRTSNQRDCTIWR